jgi:Ca2+/H+ antiporter, TMEM165/GDT1 family
MLASTCILTILSALGLSALGLCELLPAAVVSWLAAVLFLAFGVKLLVDAPCLRCSRSRPRQRHRADHQRGGEP